MRTLFVLCLMAVVSACGSAGPSEPPPLREVTKTPAEQRFKRMADEFYWAHFAAHPHEAVQLGYHQYDGKVFDPSPQAIHAMIDMYRRTRDRISAIPAGELSAQSRVERDVLLTAIRSVLFDVDIQAMWRRNPIYYMDALSLQPYVIRDYAPAAERAQAIIATCEAAGPYLDQVQKNLSGPMPRTWLATGLLMSNGTIEFAKTDVRTAMAGLAPQLSTQLNAGLDKCVAALQRFSAFLQASMASANDDYALGETRFLRMLRDKEGIHISLDQLSALSEADLARNLKQVESAAARIDRKREARAVFLAVKDEKPAASRVLAEATRMANEQRQFLIDKDIVSIPSGDPFEVRESPPFLRWNSAFLNSAGAFEKKALPSIYYISPPDPSWPEAQQRGYIPSFGDLWSTTAHEVWPGHFLHRLHIKSNRSKILKSFCTYSMSEGWAHYIEELMWTEGAGKGNPKLHLGQLGDALLRNVRFKSALALHIQGATADQSQAWFEELAFLDERNAIQQANRGTFDPGYLNYTLGKLIIMKLRDDWRAKMGDQYSLRAFHDTFLSYGCAPLPVIRREMVGDAGALL
ncbi:MAG: DUF885 domain-containing protein [Myxococcota bacterium]